MHCRAPAQDPSARQHLLQGRKNGLDDRGPVDELDHERKIDEHAQHVAHARFAALARSRYAAKDSDLRQSMLVVEKSDDLLHEIFTPAVVGFAQIDSHHRHFVFHGCTHL